MQVIAFFATLLFLYVLFADDGRNGGMA